jgi:hypothetical protein
MGRGKRVYEAVVGGKSGVLDPAVWGQWNKRTPDLFRYFVEKYMTRVLRARVLRLVASGFRAYREVAALYERESHAQVKATMLDACAFADYLFIQGARFRVLELYTTATKSIVVIMFADTSAQLLHGRVVFDLDEYPVRWQCERAPLGAIRGLRCVLRNEVVEDGLRYQEVHLRSLTTI